MPSCRPTALSSSGVGSFALATGSSLFLRSASRPSASLSCLDGDDVLWVVVGILLQVADGRRIGRRLLQVALQDLERAVLGLGDVDIEAAVVGLGIDGRLAGWAAEGVIGLER